MNHAIVRLVVTVAPFCTAAFAACIDVGHDAETGCLVDQSAPGCRAAGGSATGGSSSAGRAGGAGRAGASSSGGASTGGASTGGAVEGGEGGA